MGAREITIAYGQTEASPLITMTRTDDPIDKRVGTVGRPLPGVEVKIIDPLSGEALPDGQPGELCCRGHGVMLGYYKMPEATAKAIDADGWLHTGDIAVRQPDGYFRITGRLKDMIIRGGENIAPREIEELLYQHPEGRAGRRWWACPIGNSAKRFWPGSSFAPASRPRPRRFAVSAASHLAHFKTPALRQVRRQLSA